jgi:hypothetical protein
MRCLFRAAYGIPGTVCEDFLSSVFCTHCTICQQSREVKIRSQALPPPAAQWSPQQSPPPQTMGYAPQQQPQMIYVLPQQQQQQPQMQMQSYPIR